LVMPKGEWGFEALAPSTTLRLPHEQLCEVAKRYPAISFAFWRDTVADASILSKWLGKLGLRQATSRLAHLICELGLRLEQVGLGARTHFRVPLTQEQIADVLGITNVSVSNAFGELQREGVLDRTRSEIRIHDLTRLTNIAEFDPRYLLLDKPAAPESVGRSGDEELRALQAENA